MGSRWLDNNSSAVKKESRRVTSNKNRLKSSLHRSKFGIIYNDKIIRTYGNILISHENRL